MNTCNACGAQYPGDLCPTCTPVQRSTFDRVMDMADGAADFLTSALGPADEQSEGPSGTEPKGRKARKVIDVEAREKQGNQTNLDVCPKCMGAKHLYRTSGGGDPARAVHEGRLQKVMCDHCQGRGKVLMQQVLGEVWKADLQWAVVVDDKGSTWHNFPDNSLQAACGDSFKSHQVTGRVALEHGKRITACTSCIIGVTRR